MSIQKLILEENHKFIVKNLSQIVYSDDKNNEKFPSM